jgi:probable rRNA maturation factor
MIHFTNLSQEQIDTDVLLALGLKVLGEEGITSNEEINCIFTDNRHIQQLNAQYREKDTPTDVLAFSFAEGESAAFRETIFGDIYISVEMAKKNASEYGQTLTEEVRLLFVHGLLHLLGYNDETEENRKVMKSKEQQYLENL